MKKKFIYRITISSTTKKQSTIPISTGLQTRLSHIWMDCSFMTKILNLSSILRKIQLISSNHVEDIQVFLCLMTFCTSYIEILFYVVIYWYHELVRMIQTKTNAGEIDHFSLDNLKLSQETMKKYLLKLDKCYIS